MNKAHALQHMGHRNLVDFIVVDHLDGKGQQVVWKKPGEAPPTEGQIAAAWTDREAKAGR